MKNYFKTFKVQFIILGVLLVIAVIALLVQNFATGKTYTRVNDYQNNPQRVFDYADVLTDAEEVKLQALIEKRQQQIGCDIILVTLNENLKDYVAKYDNIGYVPVSKYAMVYADNFFDEGHYGYNRYSEADDPDGIVYVDNWNREADGYAYSWFSTSGRCEAKYSNKMIDHLTDVATDNVNSDPYGAYRDMINQVYKDMSGKLNFRIPGILIFGAAALIAIIYWLSGIASGKTKKTVVASTYVVGGAPRLNQKQDILVNKKLTSRRIETSSSGGGGSHGGGGHHTSSGGHSHGGGGGRH